jgi:hypothetical protein
VFTFLDYRFALELTTVATLAAAALAVLLLAHLAGRKRRRIVVSTADPWTANRGPVRRTVLGWRLQRWLLFLLQATIALLLVMALAEPRAHPRRTGRSLAILIDDSASMAAVVEGRSRLQIAREAAGRIAAGLGPADQALVAGVGPQLQLELGLSRDPEAIEAAIGRIEVSEEAADLPGAVAAAAQLLAGRPQIIVLGDDPPDPSVLRELGRRLELTLEYRAVGSPVENVGIAAFSLHRSVEDRSRIEVVLTARAAADRPGRAVFEFLAAPSGRSIGRRTLDLPATGNASVQMFWTAGEDTALRAVLREPVAGPKNGLALDDQMTVGVPPAPRRRVLLVSAGNLYLEGALRSFGANLLVERRSPAAVRSDLGGYDAVILDAVTPPDPPTHGRFLFIDPAGPGSPFPAGAQVRDPVPTEVRREHPLLRNVSLADLNIREARRLAPRPGDVVLASALGLPLILTRETPALRAVALAFDIRRSDLPLRPSLPLILANALDWLAGSAEPPGEAVAAAVIDPAEADTRSTARPLVTTATAAGTTGRWRPSDLLLALAFVLGLVEWWAHRRR